MKIVEAIISFALVVLTLCFVSMSTGPSDSLEIRTFNPFDGVADIIFLIGRCVCHGFCPFVCKALAGHSRHRKRCTRTVCTDRR